MAKGMINPVFDSDEARIADQLATAAALRKQGMSGNTGGGYQGGRVYMVGSPLGNVVAGLAGQYMDSQARDAQSALSAKQAQGRADFLAGMPQAEEQAPQFGPTQDGSALPDVTRLKNARQLAQETQQWAANAPQGMEGVQQFALQQALTAPQRQAEQEFRASEAKTLAEQRADAERVRQQERLESIANEKERDRALRMSMAQFAAANRPGAQSPLENVGKMPTAGKVGALPVKAQGEWSALQNLDSATKSYAQLLKSYDPQGTDALNAEKRAAVKAAFTDLQMRQKEAFALGAITGPDMQVLEGAYTDPTGVWGTVKGGVAGPKTFQAQIDQGRAALSRTKRNFEQQYKVELPDPAGTETAPMPGAAAPTGFKVLGVRDK